MCSLSSFRPDAVSLSVRVDQTSEHGKSRLEPLMVVWRDIGGWAVITRTWPRYSRGDFCLPTALVLGPNLLEPNSIARGMRISFSWREGAERGVKLFPSRLAKRSAIKRPRAEHVTRIKIGRVQRRP